MKRSKHSWGIRFEDRPLTGVHSEMYIQADVSHRPKQGVDIRFFFSGTNTQRPLRSGDVLAWMASMRVVLDAAFEEAEKI